jgi:hypothetical protein
MTDKTHRRTHEIELEMHRLETEYEESVRSELRATEPDMNSLIAIANQHSGTWSGGSCYKNTCERIAREVALKMLNDLRFK